MNITHQKAIEELNRWLADDLSEYGEEGSETTSAAVDLAVSELQNSEWHEISLREPTEEEKTEMDDPEGRVYNCELPEDGEEVLVTTKWGNVCTDTFFYEAGWCGFEFHEEPEDVIAWRRMPAPYKKGGTT